MYRRRWPSRTNCEGGRRLAKAFEAEWIAVYVETPKLQRLSETKRAQVLATLRLVEELGAETVTLTGHYIGETILAYAHERNATKVVLGKPSTPVWRRWLFSSAVEYIVSHSADIDILFISGETAESEAFTRHPRYFLRTREYLGLSIEKDTKALQHRLDYLWAVLVVFGLFASQIALALERVELATQAQDTLLRMEAERLRNVLLSAISHDLCTPLAAIVGAAGGLLSKTYQLNDEVRKELVQTIQDEATRMSGLANLGGACRGGPDRARWTAPHHPVVTSLPAELPLIWVDGLMIQRVLTNLLENAVKYTPPQSRIEIAAEEVTEGVIVSVTDNGPGLPPGEEERVFDKFYRTSPENGTLGAGLGLAICCAIVDAHGGRIWAENRYSGGAVFRFLIPRHASPPQVEEVEDDADAAVHG